MLWNDVLYLIGAQESRDKSGNTVTDEFGNAVFTRQKRMVFCMPKSIGSSEFYQSQAVGLKPEIRFVISDYLDYQNETQIEYGGEVYRVLRTFRDGKRLEITCYREVNHGST